MEIILHLGDLSLGAVSSGVMNDTGNFVLKNSNSDRLWESFDHPSDTLLPTQILEIEEFRFDAGDFMLNSINLPTGFAYDSYYRITSDASNSFNSGYRLIFNESGYMYMLRRSGHRFFLTEGTVSTADFYHRGILNFDSVFIQYFYPKTSGSNRSWSSVWSKPDNTCVNIGGGLGSGACRYNSICSLNDDKRPDCDCPQGFSLLDENDKYGSCIPDFELSCKDRLNSTEDHYDFQELINVDWPTSDYERFKPSDEDTCRKSCLNDCLFVVATFRDGCWKKKLPLSNGRVDSGMNGKATTKIQGEGDAMEIKLCCFTYKELTEATNDLKDELGRGGLGAVYKGRIPVGFTNVVAVKKLDKMVQDGEKEFKTEVNTQIIHCDIKPQNILTDDYYNARISDFGLPKFLMVHQRLRAKLRLSLEERKDMLHLNGPGTNQSLTNVDLEISEKAVLTDWAYDCYTNGTLDALLEDDPEAINDLSTVEKLLKVAFWCIHEEPSRRPTMWKVTQMLEGVVEVLTPPNPFPFSTISNDL
ncbi:unnamed protein product [Dovyalis caffra]|uniref:Bulb-type lectin domain-containing protein n=1 Tax=Dovyalis caffra TaxID=77055 RepID=A0AAV1R5D6_9ROSI|nr:unnamed protein product [Dovyalis caffra]